MAKYGEKAQEKVERAMHEMKEGKLKSGSSGKTVKSRKQAIAIGLSEARKEGGKVPAAKKAAPKKAAAKKAAPAKKAPAKKTATKSAPKKVASK
jgi:topoisomerase IA-like protein